MLNLTGVKKQNTTGKMNLLLMKGATGEQYGYRMYVGSMNLTGSGTVDLSANFAHIDAVFAELEELTAGDVNKIVKITWTEPATGQVKLWGWKHTSTSNPTLIAATAQGSVRYVVVGR